MDSITRTSHGPGLNGYLSNIEMVLNDREAKLTVQKAPMLTTELLEWWSDGA